MSDATRTLYRPVGREELDLIRESGWRRFPPRLPDQPIFYPVIQRDYAVKIARDWNAARSGAGYVTRFEVDSGWLSRFEEQHVGGSAHTEHWIPAEQIDDFNEHIVGLIEVVDRFERDSTG